MEPSTNIQKKAFSMNICMLTNTYLPHVGGVARSVSSFADEYRRRRHRVLVVAPTFQGKPPPRRAEAIVERVAAIQKFNGSDFSVSLPLSAGLVNRIEQFNPHVMHAHHPFLLGDTALRLSARMNVPIIFTHHTRYEDYTHYVPFDSPTLREFTVNLSTEFANLCDGVIAPSESLAELIRSRGVQTVIRVIPTGIDLAAFSSGDGGRFRRTHQLAADTFVVGHVGRLAPEKNLAFLAESVARFVKKVPSARFLVVGLGPSQELLKETFFKHGVPEQLVLVGEHVGPSLADAYAAMDVFAFASLSETQGLVIVEAMAAGVPVVALNASGVRDVVRNDENGLLLSPSSAVQTFARHLAQLHAEPPLRAKLGASARTTAAAFSSERCADLALGFYKEMRQQTHRKRLEVEQSPWGPLLQRISMEWDLLAEKAHSVSQAFGVSG